MPSSACTTASNDGRCADAGAQASLIKPASGAGVADGISGRRPLFMTASAACMQWQHISTVDTAVKHGAPASTIDGDLLLCIKAQVGHLHAIQARVWHRAGAHLPQHNPEGVHVRLLGCQKLVLKSAAAPVQPCHSGKNIQHLREGL
jgi:hypothetical protein